MIRTTLQTSSTMLSDKRRKEIILGIPLSRGGSSADLLKYGPKPNP